MVFFSIEANLVLQYENELSIEVAIDFVFRLAVVFIVALVEIHDE